MKIWNWLKNLFKKREVVTESVPPMAPAPEVPTQMEIDNFPINQKFEFALEYTFGNEGELSNDKYDKGGITKYGIILDDLKRIGHKNATAEDIKNLTRDEAKAIYKKLYWNSLNLDSIIHMGVATCLFDIGVVRGVGIPPQYVKEICGSWSPEAINSFDSNKFITLFAARSLDGFRQIVAKNPTQVRFIKGWTNRANRLLTLRS